MQTFQYVLSGESELKINVRSLGEPYNGLKAEVIEHTPSYIHTRMTHPCGFVLDLFQYPGKLVAKTNFELIEGNDGRFNVRLV